MFLTFPSFNIYSTPLLVLVIQGTLFGLLLLDRYRNKRAISDLFLALLVLITCYHRTTYTIGFMDWYDTYRNTKINYWLIYLGLAIGPLIFLYARAITTSDFKYKIRHNLHFLPVALYVLYRIFVFVYDGRQPGFQDTQNGVLMVALEFGFMGTFTEMFFIVQHAIYLAFTLQIYFQYKRGIQQYFSNTYRLELNWIRNFLYLYAFLFVYSVIQQLVDLSITELSWIQKWWYQFVSALVVIYVGIKGYFTDTSMLRGLQFNPAKSGIAAIHALSGVSVSEEAHDVETFQKQRTLLTKYMEEQRPYLNPELNLKDLATTLQMSRSQLSEVINKGFEMNFNDFINSYRVAAVKEMLNNNKHEQLSLLGIAHECGFNSKATFNRVFRKISKYSPSEYLKQLTHTQN